MSKPITITLNEPRQLLAFIEEYLPDASEFYMPELENVVEQITEKLNMFSFQSQIETKIIDIFFMLGTIDDVNIGFNWRCNYSELLLIIKLKNNVKKVFIFDDFNNSKQWQDFMTFALKIKGEVVQYGI